MSNTGHACRGLFLFALAFFLPPVALAIGWIGWDFQRGLVASGITFGAFALLGSVCFMMIKDPSKLFIPVPFVFGCLYSIIPDFVPIPIDDAAAVAAGGLLSLMLGLKAFGVLPVKSLVALAAAAAYTLIGDLIPGPVDELLVYGITGGIAAKGLVEAARIKELSGSPRRIR
jgi:hypothetical protein